MADTKISGLTSGGSIQDTDLIPIARGALNYSVSGLAIKAAAESVAVVTEGSGTSSLQGAGGNAAGDLSVALGLNSVSYTKGNIAIGDSAIAGGSGDDPSGGTSEFEGAVAIGENAQAIGRHAVAIGSDMLSLGINSIAVGDDCEISGQKTIAMGDSITGSGDYSVYLGRLIQGRNGENNIGIGPQVSLGESHTGQIAMGKNVAVAGDNMIAIGINANAGSPTGSPTGGIAIGESAQAGDISSGSSGDGSIAIGKNSTCTVSGSIAIGEDATANKGQSLNFGARCLQLGLFETINIPLPAGRDGSMVYDTDTNQIKYSSGASWVAVGASSGGAVDSVNGQTGVVVIDADDVSDAATTNKFATQSQLDAVDGLGALASLDQVAISDIDATGTANSSTFLRGDGTWATPAGGGGGDLLAANNLSDVASATTSRSNLGLEIGVDVQAYSSVLAATTASFTTADETKLDGVATAATANPDAVDSDTTGVTGADATTNQMSLTTAEYGAITPDASTLYFITDAV